MKTRTRNTFNTLCKNISIVFLSLYFSSSLVNAATLTVNNGFESGDLGMFNCSGNCPKISTSQKKNGKYSADFSLTKAMRTRYRTEVVPRGEINTFKRGKEYWLSFDYFYEDWKKDSFSGEIAPFQLHTRPVDWKSGCGIGSAYGTAPFLMYSKNDKMSFVTYGGKTLWEGALQKKQWLNITVRFKISKGSDGYIEAWKNGVRLGKVNGKNLHSNDGCGRPMVDPYFKMGVYKYDWKAKNSNRKSESDRRQLFIDNFKIAEGSNGYSLVSSGSTSAPVTTKAPAPKPVKATPPNIKKDTTPPVISNVQAAVTGTNATITWNTNEASSSLVKYGLSSRYKFNTNNNLLVTSHKTTLKNLVAGKMYHYQVSSKDSSGNSKVSSDLTFKVDPIRTANKEGLMAHWLMDKRAGTTITDVSGNGYTGKLINGAQLINGEGIKFDGVNDYFDAGKLNVSGKAMSLSAWFWADDLSNCRARDCRIISKATSNSEQDHYFMVSTIKSGSKTRLRFRLKTNGKTSTLIAASGNISNNEWVHVTASYDGKTMRLYKDGVEVGSRAKQGSITTNSKSAVWLGGNPPSATARPWKGHIADVRIYNYAMTKAKISALASSEILPEMDVAVPIISNIQVSMTDKTAAISWNTNKVSDSSIKYGLSRNYGLQAKNNGLLVTSHKVILKNLKSGKQYHYQIGSKDSNNNMGSSTNLTFTTESAAEEGLVAHWLMDARNGTTIADSSGNGHPGKLINGARLINGEGVKFDGVNDYLNVGNLNLAGKALSVSAWFWADDLSNCRTRDCRIISKATGNSEQSHYFMVSTIKTGSKNRLRFRLKTNGKTSTLIAASGNISNNEWIHVAAVYDGQTMRLYKDGVEVGSRAKRGSLTTNSKAPVWIGGNPPSAKSRPWKGHIGDVRIYSYPLTNMEISRLAK